MTGAGLPARYEGCLLGAFCGDALGMPYEGWSAPRIARHAPTPPRMRPAPLWLRLYAVAHGLVHDPLGGVPRLPLGTGTYTDDTEMLVSVAESLVERGGFDGADMARRFVRAYDPRRGYGPGTVRVLAALRRGTPWQEAGQCVFRGQGSFGNGAAMRVAPIGLLYRRRPDELRRAADQSALITHSHPLGREGAVLQATAVAAALDAGEAGRLDPAAFLARLVAEARQEAFADRLRRVGDLLAGCPTAAGAGRALGTGTAALESVPAALYAFLARPASFEEAVWLAVSLGGDTDTIGAMAGAIAGAYHGVDAIPQAWLTRLENGPKGRDHARELGRRLATMAS